jgi:hypothetical protein
MKGAKTRTVTLPSILPENSQDRPIPPAGTRWEKGQSGNPAGRPRGTRLSKLLRPYPVSQEGRTFAEVFAERLFEAAAMGDAWAFREVANRIEGKVPQPVSVMRPVSSQR